MRPEELGKFEGHDVILSFTDGHVVRGRIVHVDYEDRRDFIYDLVEVIEVGPSQYSHLQPGLTVAAPFEDLERFELPPIPQRNSRSAKDLQRDLGDVLLRDWDPIGIKEDPDCRDEYNAYVGPIYRLLASGATDREIAEHLVQVEMQSLGYVDTDWTTLIPVVHKLRAVYDTFGRANTA